MIRKEKHLHSYKKVNIGNKDRPFIVYKCTKLNCSHYIRPEFIEGKLSECPRCDSAYVITRNDLRNVTLHCDKCTVSREIHAN